MLKDNFFSIKNFTKNETGFVAEVLINPTHAVFAGHFPQQAVVPGVFTLQMVKECAALALGYPLRYAEMANCKFSRVIIPNSSELIHIEGSFTAQEGGFTLKASVNGNSMTYLSLKANIKQA